MTTAQIEILAVVAVPAVSALLVMGKYWGMIDQIGKTLKEVDERTRFASCKRSSETLNALNHRLSEVSKSIAALKGSGKKFAVKNSPRKLNGLGERVYREIEGEAFLEAHGARLAGMIAERKPKTAYDVERYATEACLRISDDDIFNGMKDFVYNAPSYKVEGEDGKEHPYDLTLEDVCFILSIPLRDRYLKENDI